MIFEKSTLIYIRMVAIIKADKKEKIDDVMRRCLPKREDIHEENSGGRPHKLIQKVAADVKNGRDLYFMPMKVREYDTYAGKWGSSAGRYILQLFGILSDGSKTCIIIDDIYPTIDIKVPFNSDPKDYEKMIIDSAINFESSGNVFNYKYIEIIKQYPLKGFQIYPNNYIRVTFPCLEDRKKFINNKAYFSKKFIAGRQVSIGIETAGDDINMRPRNPYYFAKVARESGLKTAGWNLLKNYRVCTADLVQEKKNARQYIEMEYSRPANGCQYTLRAKIGDINGLTADAENQLRQKGVEYSWIDKDYSIVLAWDIETYSQQLNDDDEAADVDTYEIFMICGTFHHPWSKAALSKFCITMIDIQEDDLIFNHIPKFDGCEDSESDIIIAVNTEEELLRAFACMLQLMRPDIIVGFNTGRFDWPRIFNKAKHYKLLSEFYSMIDAAARSAGEFPQNPQEERLMNYLLVPEKIKIQAGEDFETNSAEFTGILDTDAMVVFKQLNPTAEVVKYSSLNFYLKKYGLEGKFDMPYLTMFAIYEGWMLLKEMRPNYRTCGFKAAATDHDDDNDIISLEKIPSTQEVREYNKKIASGEVDVRTGRCRIRRWGALVAKYCLRDSFACQELYEKSKIIDDKREVSNTAHLDLNNAFKRANGVKVQALIAYNCFRFKVRGPDGNLYAIAYSSLRPSNPLQVTFPGAHVFFPVKGQHKEYPTTALDFSSLYPSIIMMGNLSPDKAIRKDDKYIYFIPAESGNLIGGLPEMKACLAEEFVVYLESKGYNLIPIQFTAIEGTKQKLGEKFDVSGWVVRHNGVGVIASSAGLGPQLSQNTVMARIPKTFSTDYLISHGRNISSIKLEYEERPALAAENFGVFAHVLKMLKDMRTTVKNDMKTYLKIKEVVEADVSVKTDENIYNVLKAKFDKDIVKMDPIILSYYNSDQAVEFYNEVEFRLAKLDSKQKAIKVQMNTFYGEQGNCISPINDLLVAGGITSIGKSNIKFVTNFLRSLNYSILYGDSVPGDEPVLIRRDNKISIVEIRSLFRPDSSMLFGNENNMINDKYGLGFLKVLAANLELKEYCEIEGVEVMTSKGWSKIKKVMKHKLQRGKRLYKICTSAAGCVNVTAEHSLISAAGTKISAERVDCGEILLCYKIDNIIIGADVNVNNKKDEFAEEFNLDLMIARTKCSEEKKLIYLNDDVFNAADVSILKKYHAVLSSWRDDKNMEICKETKVDAARFMFLVEAAGISLYYNSDDKFELVGNKYVNEACIEEIVSYNCDINNNNNNNFVYDLETDCGEFAAGIGRIIVHNTDSSYTTPDPSLFGCMPDAWKKIENKLKNMN